MCVCRVETIGLTYLLTYLLTVTLSGGKAKETEEDASRNIQGI